MIQLILEIYKRFFNKRKLLMDGDPFPACFGNKCNDDKRNVNCEV